MHSGIYRINVFLVPDKTTLQLFRNSLTYLITFCHVIFLMFTNSFHFYPTALKGCWGIVFTHGVRMGGRAAGNSLSGLYLRNRKV